MSETKSTPISKTKAVVTKGTPPVIKDTTVTEPETPAVVETPVAVQTEAAVPAVAAPAVKRGKGRPKGSKNKPKLAAIPAIATETAKVASVPAPVVTPVTITVDEVTEVAVEAE